MTHMNVKLILEEWLKEHKFDGLCNLDVPCGCLCGDLAPCGEMNEDCRPGHRADVEEQDVCGCDGQGKKHWHVCIEGPVAAMRKAFDEAPEWLCDCGQRCVPTAADWRWNGREWEHHHGYPIGHVTAKRSPNAPLPGEIHMSYDSGSETRKHIEEVRFNLGRIALGLLERGQTHDDSKLGPDEKPSFDEYTPKLSAVTYGSPEYMAMLDGLKPALQHHFAANSHHPEHYPNGVDGFDLFDLFEMLCDWTAATKRHNDGDILRSIEINEKRFNLSPQLATILRNTVERLGWSKQNRAGAGGVET